VPERRGLTLLTLVATIALTGCSTLLGAEPTPVPGAAATLTRSSRTPIPTPTRDGSPSPVASPAAARSPSAVAAASPRPGGRGLTEDEIAQVQRDMARIVADADLPGIEQVLLDRVALSTPAGGQVLDRAGAAAWLRDHAGPGLEVTRVDPNTQTVLLEVQTDGWPTRDPIEQGRVTFNLRRYAPNGRQDEDNGDWKVDVIAAE
jgi:hypothetical protein